MIWKVEKMSLILLIQITIELVNLWGYSILNETVGYYYRCNTNNPLSQKISHDCHNVTDMTYLIAYLSIISSLLCILTMIFNNCLKLARLSLIRPGSIFIPWTSLLLVCLPKMYNHAKYMKNNHNWQILMLVGTFTPTCNIISFWIVYKQ